jgi:calcineurin-like phosphoesterase family protein
MNLGPRTFVIADTHFGHRQVIEFEKGSRPFNTIEEHDEALVERWNTTVTKRDLVWHLGDVVFGTAGFELLGRLNGIKKLVMGNHDIYSTPRYLKYFNKVYGTTSIGGVILSHVPIHPDHFRNCIGNVHGHLHNGCVNDYRYHCVSADQTDLTPVLLEPIIGMFQRRDKMMKERSYD